MQYQSLPNCEKSIADIIILPIAHEDTVSAKVGTKDAPKAILEASSQIEYYDELLDWSPMKHINICVETELKKDSLQSIEDFEKNIQNVVNEFDEKSFLISLGGEHSITPMISSSVLKEKATIVFLDAHADLRQTYQGSKYSHACPSYRLLEQGYKMIMIGVRSMFETEAIRVKEDENIEFFSDISMQKQETKTKLLELLSSLEGEVYLSIDMDAFNPAYVPSVGTPQPGGLDLYIALDILEKLFLNKNIDIKAVDIVELIPEESNVSQVFAAKLLQKIISYWGKSKGFDKKAKVGSQMQVDYE